MDDQTHQNIEDKSPILALESAFIDWLTAVHDQGLVLIRDAHARHAAEVQRLEHAREIAEAEASEARATNDWLELALTRESDARHSAEAQADHLRAQIEVHQRRDRELMEDLDRIKSALGIPPASVPFDQPSLPDVPLNAEKSSQLKEIPSTHTCPANLKIETGIKEERVEIATSEKKRNSMEIALALPEPLLAECEQLMRSGVEETKEDILTRWLIAGWRADQRNTPREMPEVARPAAENTKRGGTNKRPGGTSATPV